MRRTMNASANSACLAAILLVTLGLGGCLSTDPSSRPSEGIPIEPLPSAAAPLGANLTECQGVGLWVFVPAERLNSKLPGNFKARDVAPAVSWINLNSVECAKTSDRQRDLGKGSFVTVSVPVVPPPELRPPKDFLSMFIFEVRTSSGDLAVLLEKAGLAVMNASAPSSIEPLPLWYDRVNGQVADGEATLYQFSAYPNKGTRTEKWTMRFFYGQGREILSFDQQSAFVYSWGDGPGSIQMRDGTVLSWLNDGLPFGTVLGTRIYGENATLDFAGSDSG